MNELKPCPFCGGGIISTHYISTHHKYPSDTVAVCCEICGAGFVKSGENALNDAHTAWNTRAEMGYKDALILLDELGLSERTCQRITHGLERDREIATISWTCSECGGHIGRDHAYCPNCGAKVVEE